MRKTADIDKYTAGLFARTEKYAEKVRQYYATAISELLELTAGSDLDGGGAFSFDGTKRLSNKANGILRALYSAVYNEIAGGITSEWEYANLSCDALIEDVYGIKDLKEDNHFARWFSRNQKAVDAFLKRKTAGMDLSQRVWQYVDNLKVEMEMALSVSLGQGDSAATVSRKVRKYLNNPDDMFRRFRYKKGEDEDGNAVYGRKWKRKYIDKKTGKVTWKDFNPGDYHTGKGVYRSAYKNAMRMTRTEINMAYRTADQDRWGRMDFVVGYRVKRSNNHPSTDICDDLSAANGDNSSSRGVYPKSFVFKGWHPQCRCFVVPIMASRTDFIKMQKALLNGEDVPQPSGKIEEPNECFNEWVSKNQERIKSAGTLPYWVQDNKKAMEKAMASAEDSGKKIGSLKDTKKVEPPSSDKTEDGPESRYEANRKEYERLLADENYTDVAFNEENGGMKATHIRHNFDKVGGEYEIQVQEVGFRNGHSVVFGAEYSNTIGERFTEGTWDGSLFEVAGRETSTENNILRGLKHCANKRKTEIAILYFPNGGYNLKVLEKAIRRYKGYRQFPERTFINFKQIICIDENGDIVYDEPM